MADDSRIPFLRLRGGAPPRWAAIALAAGVLGDLLLRGGPPGLGATLWAWTLIGLALYLRAGVRRPAPTDLALAGMAAAAAAVFTLRAAPALALLAAGLLFLGAAASVLDAPRRSGALAWVLALVTAGVSAAGMAVLGLVGSARRPEGEPAGGGRRIGVALRGALLAAPFLLVIGSLFVSADPVFARYFQAILDLGLEEAASHVLVSFLLAWVAGGLLYGIARVALADPRVGPGAAGRAAGEVVVALVLIDLLFVGFLAVQARTLFGGREFVEATAGLSYAEYARGGFFQLVVAAAIALPAVLAADWLVSPGEPRRRTFLGVAALLVGLVLAVLASAAHRMGLYLEVYGPSEARIYATTFMVWLAVSGALLYGTVLRGRREAFPALALAAGWVAVLALAVLDPAALVVRSQAARAGDPAGFDARYATSLGADAAPALLAALDGVDPESRCTISRSLLERWADPPPPDWRTWNLARWTARRSVGASEDELRETTRSCPAPARLTRGGTGPPPPGRP